MNVPRLLVLTDRRQAARSGRSLVETVARAVGAGAPAVLFREKDLPRVQRRALAEELAAIVEADAAELLVAGDPQLAEEVGALGVHLAASDPVPARSRLLLGRSCHEAAEVRQAADRVDYVTVSPVAITTSKPGYGPPLGSDGLARLVAEAGPLRVLALGGVRSGTVGRWMEAGAHGVAVLGEVMGAEDPTAVVRSLMEELEQEASIPRPSR